MKSIYWLFLASFLSYGAGVPIALTASVLGLIILFVQFQLIWAVNRRRQLEGLCAKCRYDFRGSKELCPECGSRFR
jgi:rRNA maturation endonuclease Nob1